MEQTKESRQARQISSVVQLVRSLLEPMVVAKIIFILQHKIVISMHLITSIGHNLSFGHLLTIALVSDGHLLNLLGDTLSREMAGTSK